MIYFITQENGKFVKIGYTEHDVDKRLISLQTGNPHRLEVYTTVDDSSLMDTDLHHLFNEHHYRGEWFYFHRDIKDWINKAQGARVNLITGGGEPMSYQQITEFIQKTDMWADC